MKKILIVLCVTLLSLIAVGYKVVNAEEKQRQIIYQLSANVSGGVENESVILSGVKKGDGLFYEDIKITVFEEKSGKLLHTLIPTFNYGFEPSVLPVDFDGDGISEIFYSAIDSKNANGYYYIYDFLSEAVKTIYDFEVDTLNCSAKFNNYYKVLLNLGKKTVVVDISHKDKASLSKLYTNDGKLYKQALASVSSVKRVYPCFIDGEFDLVVVREVTGENAKDLICLIVSVLELDNDGFEVEKILVSH